MAHFVDLRDRYAAMTDTHTRETNVMAKYTTSLVNIWISVYGKINKYINQNRIFAFNYPT